MKHWSTGDCHNVCNSNSSYVCNSTVAVSTITKINTHKSVSNVSFHFACAVRAVPVAWWCLAWHHIYTTVAKPFVTMVTLDPLCVSCGYHTPWCFTNPTPLHCFTYWKLELSVIMLTFQYTSWGLPSNRLTWCSFAFGKVQKLGNPCERWDNNSIEVHISHTLVPIAIATRTTLLIFRTLEGTRSSLRS